MQQKKIYLAEDEYNIRHLITSFLKKEGYDVADFETGDALLEQFEKIPADLVILDVMMPGSSGFIICTKIRAISNVPIIFLTARDSDEDFISGISLGSDAYFTKPFSPVKLMMQIKAMLRREDMRNDNFEQESSENLLVFGDLKLDTFYLEASVNKIKLKLTSTEFSFLSFLITNQFRAVSRDELLTKIWGYEAMIETRATDDTVKRLRKKLIDANSLVQIETIRGFGFKLAYLEEFHENK